MALKVRCSDGKLVELPPKAAAVEFLQEGKIALIVYIDSKGNLVYITPSSKEAERYTKSYPDAVFTTPSARPLAD